MSDISNALLLVDALIELTTRAQRIGSLLQQARDEGRDVTDEELQTLRDEDDAARQKLQDLIDGNPTS